MKLIIVSTTALLLFLGCGSNNAPEKKPVEAAPIEEITPIIEEVEEIAEEVPKKDYSSLIFSVQLGISRQRPDWVLFENGTYILFQKKGSDVEMTANAKDILRKMVNDRSTKNINGTVQKSQMAKGWIVTFGTSGIYNYVDHRTLPEGIQSKTTILEKARLNLAMDYNDLNVVKVHK